MKPNTASKPSVARDVSKSPTGITGLDEITGGGLPEGRPTLVCGGPGCGKTVLAMEFLVRGAAEFGEPGLFVSFEEGAKELVQNFGSMGFDLPAMEQAKQIKISYVELAREQIVETGAFSLDALQIRLQAAIKEIGAKRVALDTMETLFSVIEDQSTLRKELSHLFRWLKEMGLTCVITGERGAEDMTRHGFEEYVSDCVILLDHRVSNQVSKRRLRVVKYRGSGHRKDEYPFLIGKRGFSVFPITSTGLDCEASDEHCGTGVEDLDTMLGGKGWHKGSTIMISGKAGTGKSSLVASFAEATCERGERALYLALEESAAQLVRNMRSVGIDLEPWRNDGLLRIEAFRPTSLGLEEHLVSIVEAVDQFAPDCVVVDPISNFLTVGATGEVKAMLTRVLDHLKNRGVTLILTALTPGTGQPDATETEMSSLVDTWIAVEQERVDHRHRRGLYIIKSRGMDHSHDTRELIMSSEGLSLREIPHGE